MNNTFQTCILLAYTEDQCTGMVEWTIDLFYLMHKNIFPQQYPALLCSYLLINLFKGHVHIYGR